ncbi:MAG: BrnT family toxin [Hyphomicrobiales bacterium]|nr:BrnT family toxin [Hyphomicrobiales bacterium]MBV9114926.1 BrnT family toxin [Hyphomicrobiales bacterium]MBV9520611.1 BrnT family toxin [Hyphomicrobiales bacterium]
MTIRFEWDERKNRTNQRKHGVSFEVAARVFLDPRNVSRQDRMEGGEHRWQTSGLTGGFPLLVVVHTATEIDEDGEVVEIIRIISARRANRQERRRYEEEND